MAVTPGATGASFDVLLAFALDEEANKRVQSGVSTMEQELKRLQEAAADVGPEFKESGEQIKKTSEEIKQKNKEVAKSFEAGTQVVRKETTAQIAALTKISGILGSLSNQALITGGLLAGGIFAEVNRFVKEQEGLEKSTSLTREWTRATEELGRARGRVDNVLLKEALPLLQQAARVATQASAFVESHPEIVSGALKAGVLLVGIGTIGSLISKGIKLTADVKYLATIPAQLAAARLQDIAANKQLTAAQLQARAKIPGTGSGLLGGAAILAGGAAFAKIGSEASQFGASLFGTTPVKFWQDLISKVSESLPFIKQFTDGIFGVGGAAADASGLLSGAIGQIRGSANEAEIVKAFSDWKEEDRQMITEAAENRKKILADAERDIAGITRDYASQRAQISRRFAEESSKLRDRFDKENTDAERRYLEQRVEASRGAEDRIREIQEESRERRAQLEKESADRQEDFSRARDALGLVKEQRRLAEAKEEEERSTTQSVQQVRRETAARLAEIDNQYQSERALRAQEFEQSMKELSARRAAEFKEAAEAHAQELRQSREATSQKLRELQEGLNAERARRREVFIAQIRDLDSALLGERGIRNRHYEQMLAEVEQWAANFRGRVSGALSSLLSSTSSGAVGTRDSGGYADRGIYRLAWNGNKEFVMSNSTTKAAERAIGGAITQEGLIRLLAGAGPSREVNYNDYRRMDAPLSKDQRMAFQKAAEQALRFAIGA